MIFMQFRHRRLRLINDRQAPSFLKLSHRLRRTVFIRLIMGILFLAGINDPGAGIF